MLTPLHERPRTRQASRRADGRDTIGAMDDAARTPTPAPRPVLGRRHAAIRIGLPIVAAAALVAAAVLMVGPSPKSADAGFPKQPPPLALPSDTPDDSPLATAAAQLAAGQLDDARRGFTGVVAEDQDGVAGQVGLVLSRWRSTGPVSVERDMRQLVREYPESALAVLHLGLVQSLLDDPRASRQALREAVRLGRAAADPTSLRMARLANDLLHPDAFSGDLPVLVAPTEVPASDQQQVRSLLDAVQRGDAAKVRSVASKLADATGLVRVAAVSASFDKDEPDVVVDRLDAIATGSEPRPVRDRARLMATLAELWGGGDRAAGCRKLGASTRTGIDPATSRLARPIETELCH
ncbi:MAG: hypothetical protein JWL76_777 [Thermoleophilia bacterium]|nr:hypothetical protein [Thermoleophilia bacterium]